MILDMLYLVGFVVFYSRFNYYLVILDSIYFSDFNYNIFNFKYIKIMINFFYLHLRWLLS